MKRPYVVQVTFPDLKVKDAVQDARVEATGFPQAVKHALKEILRREGVKRKHYRRLSLTVSRLDGVQKTQAEPEPAPREETLAEPAHAG